MSLSKDGRPVCQDGEGSLQHSQQLPALDWVLLVEGEERGVGPPLK